MVVKNPIGIKLGHTWALMIGPVFFEKNEIFKLDFLYAKIADYFRNRLTENIKTFTDDRPLVTKGYELTKFQKFNNRRVACIPLCVS